MYNLVFFFLKKKSKQVVMIWFRFLKKPDHAQENKETTCKHEMNILFRSIHTLTSESLLNLNYSHYGFII